MSPSCAGDVCEQRQSSTLFVGCTRLFVLHAWRLYHWCIVSARRLRPTSQENAPNRKIPEDSQMVSTSWLEHLPDAVTSLDSVMRNAESVCEVKLIRPGASDVRWDVLAYTQRMPNHDTAMVSIWPSDAAAVPRRRVSRSSVSGHRRLHVPTREDEWDA